MNSTGCISLASSLLKTRGTPGFFGQLVRQPFLQLNREYHDPCEPRHLSWQWRVKDSPDVQRCSKLCLKKKSCPKKRFFPRFKKSFIYNDIFACEPFKEKKKTWGEYLSFLLPDEATSKPQMATCRKMLEHRRRKCIEADNYDKCVQGECWPLPTEWYGQGVLHISELALTRPPYKPVESVKPCPPPAHMISKCAVKKLPVCPGNDLFCLEDTSRKMPYSQFKGADTDGGPPSITLRCPIKYVPEMMPDKHQDRFYKLSCKTYGDFKNVECPPQMFNRYMDVDFNSKNLLPIPTTMPGYKPQREVKKGVCGRQTLLRPPSARNFSTGRAFMTKDYPEFIRVVSTSHLQPGRSAICFDKLIERAGMDAELLNKPIVQRQFDSAQRVRMFTEKELEKHELEAQLAEESAEEKQRRIDNKKSKLQMLIEKQNKENDKKQYPAGTVKSVGNIFGDSPNQPFGGRMVDLEEVPYQRSKFHTSARRFARKDDKRGSGQEDEKICSGCPGIRAAEESKPKGKSKCSVRRGGGRCKISRAIRPEDRLNPLALKCKQLTDSPCMRPREPFWDVVKSFRTRSTLCFPPSRHDSKRSLNEMKLRENKIYGEKMPTGVCFNKGHSETSVPFRSPLTVVLGRSLIDFKDKHHEKMLENKEQQATKDGASELLRMFANRYQTKSERKNRFTPFKDNNTRRPDGHVWAREHEGLEKQLDRIDRKYKMYHSESSSDKNTEKFFEKIKELPNALQKLNKPKKAVVIQTMNPTVEKEEIKGGLGEHVRRRRYRPEFSDELHTMRGRDTKGAVDINEYNTRSSLVSSFPVTLDQKKNLDNREERTNSKFCGGWHEDQGDRDGCHRRPRQIRNMTDQAIIDWRNQTAIDSRWIAKERGQYMRSADGDSRNKQKLDESSKWQREVSKTTTKPFRNTTDINVKDMKSAKITLKRLLQETALSKNPKDSQAKDTTDEVPRRPTARRRTIRAKCSEILAIKCDNPEQEEKRRQFRKTEDDLESVGIRLVRKKSTTCIPAKQSDGNRAHQKGWVVKRPSARKRSITERSSELLSVSNEKSKSGVNMSWKTSNFIPEATTKVCNSRSSLRRRKQLGDEVLSFESTTNNDEKHRTDSGGTSRLEENYVDVELTKTYDEEQSTGFQSVNKGEISRDVEKQGPSRGESDNMAVDSFGFGRNGPVINSVAPVSGETVKASPTKTSDVRKSGDENEGADEKKLAKEVSSSPVSLEDNTMLMLTGRQSREEVKEAVVMLSGTEEIGSRKDGKPETSLTVVSNEEHRWGDNVGNYENKNILHEKKNYVPSNKNKAIPLPPRAMSSDYSEIWRHS